MLDGRDEESFERSAERIGPYLTLMGGRMYEQTNIRWCTAALEVLSSGLRS
jgi:Virulence activator alpha C-term